MLKIFTTLQPLFAPVSSLVLFAVLVAWPGTSAWANDTDEGQLTPLQRRALVTLLDNALERTLELVDDVPKELWKKSPGEGRWSIAEVVEHLVLAEAQFNEVYESAVAGDPDVDWRAAAGQSLDPILSFARDRSQKFNAPDAIKPSGDLGKGEALAKLKKARRSTIETVRTTDLPVQQYTVKSPIGLVTLRHWFAFAAGHNERHNQQIEEIRQQLGL